jgi:hypothetical protein
MSQELYRTFSNSRKEDRLVAISCSYFMKVWRVNRPRLKAKSGTEFMKCYECTAHKAVLYGTPGIRATLDQAARYAAQVKYDAHLKVGTISSMLLLASIRVLFILTTVASSSSELKMLKISGVIST